MLYFSQIISSFLVFLLAGITALLWLSPTRYLKYGLFFAPIVGISLLGSIGLLKIGVLLIPLNPLLTTQILLGVFLLSLILRRESVRYLCRGFLSYKIFFCIPILMLCVSYFGAYSHGIFFLSAGQDEIQYVNNAVQILLYQHTGSALDTITPRIDHWSRDAVTLHLSYSQSYRRGAEIFLATVISITNSDPFLSFSIACHTAFFAYLLVVAGICRAFFRLSVFWVVAVQVFLALSHLWIMLMLQGSLANLCSIGLFMFAASAIPQLVRKSDLKANFLGGLALSGAIIFYYEVAFVALIVPLLTFLGYQIVIKKIKRNTIVSSFIVLLSTVFFANIGIYGLWMNTIGLFITNLSSMRNDSLISLSVISGAISPIMGLYSYYSQSPFNSQLSQIALKWSFIFLALYTLLIVTSINSYFRYRNPSTTLFGLISIVYFALILFYIFKGNYFFLIRSTQYLFYYIPIGLTLFISGFLLSRFKLLITIVLGLLMLININTALSTFRHLHQHTERTDPIILRYSPNSELWSNFLEYARSASVQPILVTGYDSTAKPYLIASLLEPTPSFFGVSIRRFWDTFTCGLGPRGSYGISDKVFPTDYSCPDLAEAIRHFSAQSNVAILMPLTPDPEEWRQQRLITFKRARFSPLGDVLIRDQFSPATVTIDGKDAEAGFKRGVKIHHDFKVIVNYIKLSQRFQVEIVFDEPIRLSDFVALSEGLNLDVASGKTLTVRGTSSNLRDSLIEITRIDGLVALEIRIVEIY